MAYSLGSLCSGYSGLETGVTAALDGEVQTAWVADNDKGAAAILAHRYPGIPNLGDITSIRWEDVPPVNVMCVGWPCQPVSGAGKRKGMSDERWIWPCIAEGIGRMGTRPGMLVLENVPRLLTSDGGAAMAQVVYSLAALGYVGRYGIFRASDAGAPHRRERWFCIACLAGSPGIGAALTDNARPLNEVVVVNRLFSTPRASDGGWEGGPDGKGKRASSAGWGLRNEVRNLAQGTWNGDWAEYGPAVRQWESVTGNTAPCPVEAGRSGKPRLSPGFSEWMMGLPPGWVTDVPDLSRGAQLRAIGNGVVPQAADMAVRELCHPVAGSGSPSRLPRTA